ncbi:MAG: polysaccharide biosynthesis C-terminal domain-containing protein, partial [Clostridia bacterium]|nr:polysaccharide biosynthesis C-terminal domain-containing protein [Clostridia bacterium]
LGWAERDLAVLLLAVGCASIPLTALQQLYGAMLTALDKSVTVVRHLVLAAMVRVGLAIVLLRLGIVGASIANVVGMGLALLLNATSYYRLVGKLAIPSRWWRAVLATLVMAGVIAPICYYFDNNLWSTALCCLLGGAVYVTILFVTALRRHKAPTVPDG